MEPGRDYGVEMEILDGLKIGEEVAVDPTDAVEEGALVQIAAPNSRRREDAMRCWLQAAMVSLLLPMLGEAQTGFLRSSFISPYEAKPVPPENFQNSERIFDLMHAGQLYLSLADAIALALENNLDIEVERYLPRIAGTDITRAEGGGLLRGLSLLVDETASWNWRAERSAAYHSHRQFDTGASGELELFRRRADHRTGE